MLPWESRARGAGHGGCTSPLGLPDCRALCLPITEYGCREKGHLPPFAVLTLALLNAPVSVNTSREKQQQSRGIVMKVGDTPDHEPGTNRNDLGAANLPDLDSDQPEDWEEEDGDRLNEMFAAISDDPLEWAEQQAEMHDRADWGGAGDHLPD